jgi:hypothetical protein
MEPMAVVVPVVIFTVAVVTRVLVERFIERVGPGDESWSSGTQAHGRPLGADPFPVDSSPIGPESGFGLGEGIGRQRRSSNGTAEAE